LQNCAYLAEYALFLDLEAGKASLGGRPPGEALKGADRVEGAAIKSAFGISEDEAQVFGRGCGARDAQHLRRKIGRHP
jgi:hypothetical protein